MLAAVMNSIFLQATMGSIGMPTRVQTAFHVIGCRTIHPPKSSQTFRERKGGYICCWAWEPAALGCAESK